MAVTLVSTGVQFPDNTTQTTAATAGGPSLYQFYNSGSYSVVVPSGVTRALITGCGGGGRGYTGGGGGTAGAIIEGYMPVVAGGTLNIVVGAGSASTTISGTGVSTVTLGAGGNNGGTGSVTGPNGMEIRDTNALNVYGGLAGTPGSSGWPNNNPNYRNNGAPSPANSRGMGGGGVIRPNNTPYPWANGANKGEGSPGYVYIDFTGNGTP